MRNLFVKSNLKYVFHIAVLGGLIVVGIKYLSGDEVWRALRRFNWSYAPLIILLSTAYIVVKGHRFVSLLKEVENARGRVILRGYMASQAAVLLPGGVAARAGVLEQAGVPLEASAAAIAHSSFSDQLILLLCSILSALWLEEARRPVFILISVLLVISILLGLQATRTWLLGVVEWVLGKVHLLDRWRTFLQVAQEMLTPGSALISLAYAAFACALMVECVHLCVKGVGATIPYPTLLLAFALPALMGRISALPGGVGVTEAGMIGILNAAPNVSREQAAAAVVVFRLGTVFLTAIVGALIYYFGWEGDEENAIKKG